MAPLLCPITKTVFAPTEAVEGIVKVGGDEVPYPEVIEPPTKADGFSNPT
jgi:hypothetical protein